MIAVQVRVCPGKDSLRCKVSVYHNYLFKCWYINLTFSYTLKEKSWPVCVPRTCLSSAAPALRLWSDSTIFASCVSSFLWLELFHEGGFKTSMWILFSGLFWETDNEVGFCFPQNFVTLVWWPSSITKKKKKKRSFTTPELYWQLALLCGSVKRRWYAY